MRDLTTQPQVREKLKITTISGHGFKAVQVPPKASRDSVTGGLFQTLRSLVLGSEKEPVDRVAQPIQDEMALLRDRCNQHLQKLGQLKADGIGSELLGELKALKKEIASLTESIHPQKTRLVARCQNGIVSIEKELGLRYTVDCLFDGGRAAVQVDVVVDCSRRKDGSYALEHLGAGTFADVYSATAFLPDGTKRIVALKVTKKEVLAEGKEVSLAVAQAEGGVLASLSHENILHCYGVGTTSDGLPVLVLEQLAGSLSERARHLSAREIAEAGRDLAHGLIYMHKEGFAHRDIKPANCFVVETFTEQNLRLTRQAKEAFKLGDLGAGVPFTEVDFENMVGTFGYMAPEFVLLNYLASKGVLSLPQIKNTLIQNDIFALGATLYVLFTGKFPFDSRNYLMTVPIEKLTNEPEEVLRALPEICSQAVQRVNNKLPQENIPDGLYAIIAKATSYDPRGRYQDVRSMLIDLQAYLIMD